MEGRREFEDRLAAALERARTEGTQLAVIVGELIGLLTVNARFGHAAGEAAVHAAAERLSVAVEGRADAVAEIGEGEFAVLLTDVGDRSDAELVMERIDAAFLEPHVIDGQEIVLGLAMGANLGPGRRRTDMDLLWRTAAESGHQRSNTRQQLVDTVRGEARGLDEVGQAFADEGVTRFGLDACVISFGGRDWQSPATVPDRAPDVERSLRTSGRAVGAIRWWGPVPEEADVSGVDVILGHVAAALDRAADIDETDVRSRTDPLTGLLNRDGLAHELEDLEVAYAVGVLDLDHFKAINDAHGHHVGDRVLADLAQLLRRGRTGDLIARWGGEEIVLVMPSTTVDGALARMQRLLEEARTFVRVDEVGPITFSAGVTGSDPSEPFAEAIRRADEAMYRAKRAGRARVEAG